MYRRHLRLKEFDYSSSNFYFVTVCTDFRKKLFVPRISKKYSGNDVVRITNPLETELQKKENTDIIEKVLLDLEQYYTNLTIDFYVMMPDHIHVIIAFEGTITLRSTHTQLISNPHYTLGDIIKIFKKVCTKQLGIHGYGGQKVFQPNFYEHVIRNEQSLTKIRQYVLSNPMVEYQNITWKVLTLANFL